MHPILKKLAGGNRGSIGHSSEVVAQVLAHPAYFPDLFEGLSSDDPVIRMRAADAVEKITVQRPDLLRPFKRTLLAIAGSSSQQEVRWHAALILPRVALTSKERAVALDILFDYLRDKSSIVKTFAMQAIWDLAALDPKLKAQIIPLIEELTLVGTAAMRARGRKLLRRGNITPPRPRS
jgi:HEAT repeat protein